MSAPLSQLRIQLKKFWADHPEAIRALQEAYAESTTDYKKCVTHTPDGRIVIDPACYKQQAADLAIKYADLWGSVNKR